MKTHKVGIQRAAEVGIFSSRFNRNNCQITKPQKAAAIRRTGPIVPILPAGNFPVFYWLKSKRRTFRSARSAARNWLPKFILLKYSEPNTVPAAQLESH